MAQEEKIIIELDFDTSEFTKNAAKLNQEISDLNKEQRALKKAGEEGSIQYQKNTEALKENKKALNENNKTIQNLNIANKSAAGSNEQLKAQLSLLTAEYNKLDGEQRQSGARGKELNAQINQLTDSLKNNEEAVGDNRRSVGDYEKANRGLADGFGDLDDATGGYGEQLKALLANPVVLVITGIVAVFALLKKAFTRSEEGSNKFAKAQAVLSGVMTAFMDVLESVANNLVDMFSNPMEALESFADALKKNITNRIDGLLELIPQLGKAISQVFSGDFAEAGKTATNAVAKVTLGVDDIVGKVQSAGDALGEFAKDAEIAANKAAKLADAEAALVKSQRNLEILQLTSLKNAEKQRQVRDDVSKSIEERIAANTKLGEILEEQSKKELAIANQALAVANLNISLNGKSTEALDQRKEALIGIAEIEERITGQQSEQLVNINSLNQEKADADLAEAERKMNLAIDVAQSELDLIVQTNKTKIEEGKFLNDELFAQEQKRLEDIKNAEIAFQEEKLAQAQATYAADSEAGIAAQREYNDAINTINAENEAANEELALQKKEADAEQAIVDAENQREIDILNRESEFETKQTQLNEDRAQELKNAESTGADKKLINEKYDKFDQQLRTESTRNSLAQSAEVFGQIAGLAEQGSVTQKALAVTQATINGFLAVTSILAAPPSTDLISDGIIRAARIGTTIAVNAANVAKIASARPPKKAAKGGIFGGNLHSNGGTKGYFDDGTQIEVEKDELFMVINRNSTDMINRMSDINQAGGGVAFGRGGLMKFQDGGIGVGSISGSIDSETNSANNTIEAISSQPAPVVVVQDINEVQGETAEVIDRATI